MTGDNKLEFVPLVEKPELVCASIRMLLVSAGYPGGSRDILVAEIDPQLAGGEDLCSYYNIPPQSGVNCIVVEATRSEQKQFAACLYAVGSRVDINKTVRKQLNARRVSLAAVADVIDKTGMEYGSITPIGLPANWPVLMDANILHEETIIIGSGKINSKLCLPTKRLVELTNAIVIEGLAAGS